MKRLVLVVLLALFVGCEAEKPAVPPKADAERIKEEQERMKNQAKQMGESRM